MECGGNKAFKEFLMKHAITDMTSDAKYTTRAAQLYRQKLKALANATPSSQKTSIVTPFGTVDTSVLVTNSPDIEEKQKAPKPKAEQQTLKPLMSQKKV